MSVEKFWYQTGGNVELLPADVQMRGDAELGSAWRRCEAALPKESMLAIIRRFPDFHRDGAYLAEVECFNPGYENISAIRPTPTAALTALAEALERRRETSE